MSEATPSLESLDKKAELSAFLELCRNTDQSAMGTLSSIMGKVQAKDFEDLGKLYDNLVTRLKEMEVSLSPLAKKGDDTFAHLEDLRSSMLEDIGGGSELPNVDSLKKNGQEFRTLVSGMMSAMNYLQE